MTNAFNPLTQPTAAKVTAIQSQKIRPVENFLQFNTDNIMYQALSNVAMVAKDYVDKVNEQVDETTAIKAFNDLRFKQGNALLQIQPQLNGEITQEKLNGFQDQLNKISSEYTKQIENLSPEIQQKYTNKANEFLLQVNENLNSNVIEAQYKHGLEVRAADINLSQNDYAQAAGGRNDAKVYSQLVNNIDELLKYRGLDPTSSIGLTKRQEILDESMVNIVATNLDLDNDGIARNAYYSHKKDLSKITQNKIEKLFMEWTKRKQAEMEALEDARLRREYNKLRLNNSKKKAADDAMIDYYKKWGIKEEDLFTHEGVREALNTAKVQADLSSLKTEEEKLAYINDLNDVYRVYAKNKVLAHNKAISVEDTSKSLITRGVLDAISQIPTSGDARDFSAYKSKDGNYLPLYEALATASEDFANKFKTYNDFTNVIETTNDPDIINKLLDESSDYDNEAIGKNYSYAINSITANPDESLTVDAIRFRYNLPYDKALEASNFNNMLATNKNREQFTKYVKSSLSLEAFNMEGKLPKNHINTINYLLYETYAPQILAAINQNKAMSVSEQTKIINDFIINRLDEITEFIETNVDTIKDTYDI